MHISHHILSNDVSCKGSSKWAISTIMPGMYGTNNHLIVSFIIALLLPSVYLCVIMPLCLRCYAYASHAFAHFNFKFIISFVYTAPCITICSIRICKLLVLSQTNTPGERIMWLWYFYMCILRNRWLLVAFFVAQNTFNWESLISEDLEIDFG